MITLVTRLLRRLSRSPAALPADPFGEPSRDEPSHADPFFEGVKATTGSRLGITAL